MKLALTVYRNAKWYISLSNLLNDKGHLQLWHIKKRITKRTIPMPTTHRQHEVVFSDVDEAKVFVDSHLIGVQT